MGIKICAQPRPERIWPIVHRDQLQTAFVDNSLQIGLFGMAFVKCLRQNVGKAPGSFQNDSWEG